MTAAAAVAFRKDGLGASVNVIAADAGLNVATLYRHFPTKDDLVAAVLDEMLEPLAQARDIALESEDVLATFIHEAARRQREHHGLVDALRRDPTVAGALSRLRDPAIEIVEPVVERAHASGSLRADYVNGRGVLALPSANLKALTLPAGTKAGLVGRNGTGKTTLFKAITGEMATESGSISFPKHTRIGQVAQEAPGTEERPSS